MPSPFYTPGPDIFGGGLQARREAQADFSDRLGQLYAGGNQQAGQVLGGIAPDKLDAIRSALEKMPATEQAKAKQRVDMLKKWIYSISQTQDEPTRALLWNQMIAQAHQSGADVSQVRPNYSAEALAEAQNGIFALDEIMNMRKESRLAESAGGNGTEGERRDAELAKGDPSSTEWQTKYLNRYMTPQRTGFNPITGAAMSEYIPAPYEVAKKALSVGLGLNAPSQQVYNAFNARKEVATTGTTTTATTDVPAAAGDITTPGSVINGTPIPQTAAVVPTTSVQGPAPATSLADRQRREAEDRAEARRRAEEERKQNEQARLPQYLLDAMTANKTQLARLALLEKTLANPNAASALGAQNMIPGAAQFGKYLRSGSQNDLLGLIAGLQSMTYKDISGANVTASEEPRLSQYVPNATDDVATTKRKVARFISEYRAIQQGLIDAAKSQKYIVPESVFSPDAGKPTGTTQPSRNRGAAALGL